MLSGHETRDQRRIEGIVARLAAEVDKLPRLPEHRKHIPWRVYIGDQPLVNAVAACGGQIVVFKGAPATCMQTCMHAPARGSRCLQVHPRA